MSQSFKPSALDYIPCLSAGFGTAFGTVLRANAALTAAATLIDGFAVPGSFRIANSAVNGPCSVAFVDCSIRVVNASTGTGSAGNTNFVVTLFKNGDDNYQQVFQLSFSGALGRTATPLANYQLFDLHTFTNGFNLPIMLQPGETLDAILTTIPTGGSFSIGSGLTSFRLELFGHTFGIAV
jgi:hypothetical protein